MPVLHKSTYSAPLFFSNGNFQSIYAHRYRKVNRVAFERQRIRTHDGDFLDLDWLRNGSDKLAILTHGMEGSSRSNYINGMAEALALKGWDVLAWNLRGCSGETNLLPRCYHAGDTGDLKRVFSHALFKKLYSEISLIGFSLGGNLVLKFLGENGDTIESLIKCAVVFSVPCNLEDSVNELAKTKNKKFLQRFMASLLSKARQKQALWPEEFKSINLDNLKDLRDFDNALTAPLHGFKNAQDYWNKCSADRYLQDIHVPTLLVNSKNDPFLGEKCYPIEQAGKNPALFLEMPRSGGHVGFIKFRPDGRYWSELRALEFMSQQFERPENRDAIPFPENAPIVANLD